ncbi:MAG: 30S ribosome-binding factor RbfA [Pseudomonadota bacterium]
MSKKSPKASAHAPSQRMLRVGELVRHKLAEMLSRAEVHDDALSGAVITIPEVRMTPDLKTATVYVMPLGGENAPDVIDALDRNKKFIRGEVARAVQLKYAPDLKFRFDDTFDEAAKIDALLRGER